MLFLDLQKIKQFYSNACFPYDIFLRIISNYNCIHCTKKHNTTTFNEYNKQKAFKFLQTYRQGQFT